MKRLIARIGIVPVVFAMGLLVGGVFTGTAMAVNQPHMQNALTALKTAQSELNLANNNKGGYRVSALKYVNSAIWETEQGINYVNQNQ